MLRRGTRGRGARANAAARARRAVEAGYRAADRRLPVSEGARGLLRKAFPDHWSFLLGEIALYSFVVLLLTGVYLTLFFEPGMTEAPYHGSYGPLRGVPTSEAYASVLRISFDVRGGLLIRQVHHWAALVFVAAAGVHLLRVFFTGAFRRPREANWVIGVTLFLLAVVEGFCGYSLPDDLLSGTGLRIAQGVMLSVPVVGTYLSFLAFGGQYPGHDIIPRLYPLHILLVPGLLLGLLVAHLILVVYLKHTHWAAPGRTNRDAVGQPMFPQFAVKSTGLFLMVFGLLAALGGTAQVNPVWTYGPYRTDHVSTGSQPDWYVGFLEGSLRLMPAWETDLWGHTVMWNVFVPTVLLPLALFTALYLYPFFERWVTGDRGEHHLCDRPRDRPVRTGLGAAGITFYAVLLAAGGNDVLAHAFGVSLNTLTWTFRVLVVLGPAAALWLARRVCLALQERDRERLAEGEETGEVRQAVDGGLTETRRPLPARRRYVLHARDLPETVEFTGRTGRRQRLRTALNSWYYRDRVDLPDSPQGREVAARTTAQPEPPPRD
ncbi:ubiquinol-cytochrome c reductase cytochrome b subunit [Streptomyces sp. B1866]|uniref:cytochrome bc1 complex cytochrome b subunit n=1 Tax=Streptomyces sp. B1866 TaxID=3075431 RepID=UPI002890EF24|nr:ubiquinol-cytochrome c reductase cytochrome b subunit [Streptomyces sp. B1866]MDT3396852.1 ubiquinol-cytochrome c reductase cytochrome b subunit [Streptomyces sp. B1866]